MPPVAFGYRGAFDTRAVYDANTSEGDSTSPFVTRRGSNRCEAPSREAGVAWEIAGLAHPYYDLATFATFLALDAPGRPAPVRARFDLVARPSRNGRVQHHAARLRGP
jgi:hypothetical protein